MILTQISCSTIIRQKKVKIIPGANASAALGKRSVISAAKIQWVPRPRAWPAARWRLGKI